MVSITSRCGVDWYRYNVTSAKRRFCNVRLVSGQHHTTLCTVVIVGNIFNSYYVVFCDKHEFVFCGIMLKCFCAVVVHCTITDTMHCNVIVSVCYIATNINKI